MLREVEVQVERRYPRSVDNTTGRTRRSFDGKELGGLTPSDEEARQWLTARAAI